MAVRKNYICGCGAVGTIFKDGMCFGIIIVMAVIVLVFFLANRSKK